MSEKIIVPTLGESVTEATVSKWLKSVGEKVGSDEPLVELETDKVNVEVPSPSSGILEKIAVKEGETVEVGALLGSVGASLEKPKDEEVKKTYTPPIKKIIKEEFPIYDKPTTEKKNGKNKIKPETNGLEKLILEEPKEEPALVLNDEYKQEEKIIKTTSPSARKLAKEQKINLEQVEGSGKRGMVLKGDLLSLMGSKPAPNLRKQTHGEEERIKMTRLRMTIAKRLKEAQNSAAMLSTFNEVDMFNIIETRNNYKNEFQEKYSVKLGFMSFFLRLALV